jgi:hypothetical protein
MILLDQNNRSSLPDHRSHTIFRTILHLVGRAAVAVGSRRSRAVRSP